MTEIPELENMWKEREELEETKDESDDPFIPAKLATHEPDEKVLVKITL
jgi:hypothetical protein